MTILKLSFRSMRYFNFELQKGKGVLSESIAKIIKFKVSEWEWVKNFRNVRGASACFMLGQRCLPTVKSS